MNASEFDDYDELADIANELVLWWLAHDVACPFCAVYGKAEAHGPRCPIGSALGRRTRNVSTV